MENNKKPLYCFRLDEQTATLTRYEIDNYREYLLKNEDRIAFNASLGSKNQTKYDFPRTHLDKVFYMKIYTFNPDFNEALAMINAELICKREAAYKEYNKLNELIINLNKNCQNQ